MGSMKEALIYSSSPRCEERFLAPISCAVQLQRPLCAVMFELVTSSIAERLPGAIITSGTNSPAREIIEMLIFLALGRYSSNPK